ncbi:MAG: hypothetical protein RIB84_06945 [Sneathiellaceae bacterium]
MSRPDRRGEGTGGAGAAGDSELGALIQAYIRTRWSEPAASGGGDQPSAQPDAELRERLEVLGLDALKLLRIAPGAVPGELRLLEQQSMQEDARALAAAGRHWARGETGGSRPFDGTDSGNRSTARQPAGRQRQAGARRSGPSRGSR